MCSMFLVQGVLKTALWSLRKPFAGRGLFARLSDEDICAVMKTTSVSLSTLALYLVERDRH